MSWNNSNKSSGHRSFNNVPPPQNLNVRHSYERADEVYAKMMESKSSSSYKRKATNEDDYFEDDEPEESMNKHSNNEEEEEEEDPLDAFMKDLEKGGDKGNDRNKTTKKISDEESANNNNNKKAKTNKGIRDDIELEDAEESYYSYMEANPNAGIGTFGAGSDAEDNEESDRIEYDKDGNPVAIAGKKMIDPLPMIYHSEIEYQKFEKNFYEEHEDVKHLSGAQVYDLRKKLGIQVSGPSPPKPVTSFGHFNFDEQLMKTIRKLEYVQPTSIQAQAIPAALSGRDLIGIAKTGSGKTAAFIWPMIVHIMDQPELKKNDGPIGIILAPTRELSLQIYNEAKRFSKPYGIRVICAYGGGNKWEQCQDIQAGAEILVGTPGRIIDFVKMKAMNFLRVTFLVLDEADRMFDMGFEAQVRSICNHVRPDRQCLMFSATFKKRIEKLARDVLTDPIRIVQGDHAGDANENIRQIVHIFKSGTNDKWDWLTKHLVEFSSEGSVIIFVGKKSNSQELAKNLEEKTNFVPLLIHGDLNQFDRNNVIQSFKKLESRVLVATDVAARGLDISHVKFVINYDMAKDIDTHTHRIGRTGRAGETGTAITLITEADKESVGHLVRNLESANQNVPEELMQLAMQSQWFRKSRFQSGKGKKSNTNTGGFQPRNRMGLGSGNQSSAGSSTQKPSFSSTFVASSMPYSSSTSSTTSFTAQKEEHSAPQQQPVSNALKAHFQSKFRSQFTSAASGSNSSNSNTDSVGSQHQQSRNQHYGQHQHQQHYNQQQKEYNQQQQYNRQQQQQQNPANKRSRWS